MDDYKALIYALKCSASAGTECKEDCPYRLLEEITPDLPIPADTYINGTGYWITCDCDRMATDAADAIEQLVKERDAAVKAIPHNCFTCKKFPIFHKEGFENDFCNNSGYCNWEWRGVQEVEHEP